MTMLELFLISFAIGLLAGVGAHLAMLMAYQRQRQQQETYRG